MKEYLNQEDRKRSAHPRPVKLAKQPESHRKRKIPLVGVSGRLPPPVVLRSIKKHYLTMVTEELTYADVYVKEPQKALLFMTQYLGFFNYGTLSEMDKPGRHGFLVKNKWGNNFFIALQQKGDLPQQALTINTDDCLRDYYRLGQAGVKCESMPRYTGCGLEFTVADQNGNKYILLEQRDYSDEE